MRFVILLLTAGIPFQAVTCTEIIPSKNAFDPIIEQHHAQDILGRYTYGYITPTSTKSESKGPDGIIRGGYSYLDPKGNLQSVHYVADPYHGFLVAASNLPQDVPSVAYAKLRHLQDYEAIKAEHAAVFLSKLNPSNGLVSANLPQDVPIVARAKQRHLEKYEAIKAQHAALALSQQDAHAALIQPNPVHDLPAVARAKAEHLAAFEAVRARDLAAQAAKSAEDNYVPIVPTDGLNYYTYGYIQPTETSGILHNTDGQGYSYMDSNGAIKTVNYINY